MTESPLTLIAIGAALATVAGQLWRNRRSVREKQRLLTLWVGFAYGYRHGKLDTPQDVAWQALAQTEPGTQPPTPEL
jgi:hypothetical protein